MKENQVHTHKLNREDEKVKDNEIMITEHHHLQRLDNFLLLLLKDQPKSYIYKLIRQGQVRVNKSRAKAMQKLRQKDCLRLPPFLINDIQDYKLKQTSGNLSNSAAIHIPKYQFEIIYEDSFYLAINKPYGMPVHSGSGHEYGVIDILRCHHSYDFIELVHRLDKDTSGCLILAKSRQSLLAMQQYFVDKINDYDDKAKKQSIKKDYLTLLLGHLAQPMIHKDELVKSQVQSGERMVITDQQDSSKSKQAISVFTPVTYYSDDENTYSLARVEIITGRTHQIRVQSAQHGNPIIGDRKYGDKIINQRLKVKTGLKRMFLHAHKISLIHPMTKREIEIMAPMDNALEECLNKLTKIG